MDLIRSSWIITFLVLGFFFFAKAKEEKKEQGFSWSPQIKIKVETLFRYEWWKFPGKKDSVYQSFRLDRFGFKIDTKFHQYVSSRINVRTESKKPVVEKACIDANCTSTIKVGQLGRNQRIQTKDAYIKIKKIIPSSTLYIGLFRPPTSRQCNTSGTKQTFVDRAEINQGDFFSGEVDSKYVKTITTHYACMDRSIGVGFFSHLWDFLEIGFAALNGDSPGGVGTDDIDNRPIYAVRVNFHPLGYIDYSEGNPERSSPFQFAIGLFANYGRYGDPGKGDPVIGTRTAYGGDITIKGLGGLYLTGEYHLLEAKEPDPTPQDNTDDSYLHQVQGTFGQMSYTFPLLGAGISPGIRYEINIQKKTVGGKTQLQDKDGNDLSSLKKSLIGGVIDIYIYKHKFKFQFEYMKILEDPELPKENLPSRFRFQMGVKL